MATGDLGAPAYRKYDIEAWMPGLDQYGEVGSKYFLRPGNLYPFWAVLMFPALNICRSQVHQTARTTRAGGWVSGSVQHPWSLRRRRTARKGKGLVQVRRSLSTRSTQRQSLFLAWSYPFWRIFSKRMVRWWFRSRWGPSWVGLASSSQKPSDSGI